MDIMQERARHRKVSTRIVRPGQRVPEDTDWGGRTLEERIAGVWELTRLCLEWNREGNGEPRLL